MRKNFVGLLILAVIGCASIFTTGCSSVQGYSVRSYQGPLPMSDYQFVGQQATGVPEKAAQ